jgi:hypothetical protein
MPERDHRIGQLFIDSTAKSNAIDAPPPPNGHTPDDGGVGALGDEEGDVAVAEVVEPHRWADRVCDGGEPEAAAEGVAADGSAFGGGEDQPVRVAGFR